MPGAIIVMTPIYFVFCYAGPETAGEPRWLLRRGHAGGTILMIDDTGIPVSFATIRDVISWARGSRVGVELPAGVLYTPTA